MGDTNYYDLPYPASTDKVSLGYQNMQDLAEQIDTILNDANIPIVGDGANVLRTDTVFASAVIGTYNNLVLDPTVALPNGMFATTQTQNDGSTKVATTSYVDTAALNFTLGIIPDNSLTNVKINSAAAIAYSKLNLTTSIVNADISASAAIAYSKLNLASSITSADIVDDTIVNADINANASIVDTKLATISTALKVSNSATTATSANTASAIVSRDASGNFTAGTITANITGNVSGSSGSTTGNAATVTTNANLTGDVTSVGNTTTITALPDSKLATIATALKVSNSATTATDANTASAIVARDASGNFTAGLITANSGVSTSNAVLSGYFRRAAPVSTAGAATHTVAATTSYLYCTAACTLTLPTAFAGRELIIKNTAAGAIISASSNVYPIGSTVVGTAILAATAGKFATLVGDGTNWIIMQAN